MPVKINYRRIAESMWGRDGTTGYRTNRRGAYYYSCAGHGGYIVDADSLTASERSSIEKYIKPSELPLLVDKHGTIHGKRGLT